MGPQHFIFDLKDTPLSKKVSHMSERFGDETSILILGRSSGQRSRVTAGDPLFNSPY